MELERLNKLKERLTEIAQEHGLQLRSFLVDPSERTTKSSLTISSDALKSVEQKETEKTNEKFDEIIKGW